MTKVVYILLWYALIDIISGIQAVWAIDERIYFVAQQICTLLLLYAIRVKNATKIEKIITDSLIILTLCEVWDELHLLNDKFRINDYLITALVVLWAIIRIQKCRKRPIS